MRRTLSVLGSSGSIGRQALDVAAVCGHEVAAITVNRSAPMAEEQARRFRPRLAVPGKGPCGRERAGSCSRSLRACEGS